MEESGYLCRPERGVQRCKEPAEAQRLGTSATMEALKLQAVRPQVPETPGTKEASQATDRGNTAPQANQGVCRRVRHIDKRAQTTMLQAGPFLIQIFSKETLHATLVWKIESVALLLRQGGTTLAFLGDPKDLRNTFESLWTFQVF